MKKQLKKNSSDFFSKPTNDGEKARKCQRKRKMKKKERKKEKGRRIEQARKRAKTNVSKVSCNEFDTLQLFIQREYTNLYKCYANTTRLNFILLCKIFLEVAIPQSTNICQGRQRNKNTCKSL